MIIVVRHPLNDLKCQRVCRDVQQLDTGLFHPVFLILPLGFTIIDKCFD